MKQCEYYVKSRCGYVERGSILNAFCVAKNASFNLIYIPPQSGVEIGVFVNCTLNSQTGYYEEINEMTFWNGLKDFHLNIKEQSSEEEEEAIEFIDFVNKNYDWGITDDEIQGFINIFKALKEDQNKIKNFSIETIKEYSVAFLTNMITSHIGIDFNFQNLSEIKNAYYYISRNK